MKVVDFSAFEETLRRTSEIPQEFFSGTHMCPQDPEAFVETLIRTLAIFMTPEEFLRII